MADPILHIKDCYYFEVPKFLWRSKVAGKHFPKFWVRLDEDFQNWEAGELYHGLEGLPADGAPALPSYNHLKHEYDHWRHDHANHGKPFDLFLEEHAAKLNAEYKEWKAKSPDNKDKTLDEFVAAADAKHEEFAWFAVRLADPKWSAKWRGVKEQAGGDAAVDKYQHDDVRFVWPAKKVEGYNNALSGKILIPQFGRQKNLYEMESGNFGISKFMLLEAFVAFVIVVVFAWLAMKVRSGDRPQGKAWNLLEAVLLFIRDQIARPSIDGHDHHDEGHGEHGHSHDAPGHSHAVVKKHPEHEGDKYVPYLWTIFLFVLGCNLVGMFPWAGAPAASFGITLSFAAMTFLVGFISGVRKFGFLGYWKNQVPSMELPLYMAIPLLPAIFVIEVVGLFIKHGVLGIRLLANIAAGHLVLVSILGLTFSVQGVTETPALIWPFASLVAVLGSAALSCLELFVAFLQAYVFTLLSALFIGAAVHKH